MADQPKPRFAKERFAKERSAKEQSAQERTDAKPSAESGSGASNSVNVRLLALRIAARMVVDGVSLGELLPVEQEKLTARDAALLQELVFGVARWSGRLECQLGLLLKKPLRRKETDISVLLWLALYELQYMRSPDYAVVNAYTDLTAKLRKKWAKALVNGVLRQFLRTQQEITAKADQMDAGRTSLPSWIWRRIQTDWSEQAQNIVQASNKKAPLVLRINRSLNTRAQYLQLIERDASDNAADDAIQSQFRNGELGQDSLILDVPVKVQTLPGYENGLFSVQDSAAQLAAELVAPQPGQKILDACAAPGGKTCHLLELQPDCSVTAIDSSEHRLQRVNENLQRLKLDANCVCADAASLDSWWDGDLFDTVLLDAPCSALGVLRRHPDIRLLRRETDIDALVEQQHRLLAALWQTVKTGGKLVYATCSILKCENQQQITGFVKNNSDAVEQQIDANWGFAVDAGRQILPGQHEADGFYYAIIRKKSPEDVR